MSRQVKCQYCQQFLEKEEAIRFEEKNFHPQCCQEYKDRKEIFKYVAHLFGFKSENKPGPVILSQLKLFREKYPLFTNRGILNALIYYYEVKRGSVKKAKEGIGIVPFVYEEAEQYYRNLSFKQEQVAKAIEQQLKKEPTILKVKKPQEKKKEKTFYNLEDF